MQTTNNVTGSYEPGSLSTSNCLLAEEQVTRKVGRRLMWYLMALYFCSIMDRGNISFAALSMNKAIGLSAETFGIGVGVMFVTYSLFEVPSNLLLARIGARATLTRIAILWGAATMLMACAQGPFSFYALRALLGMAEAGLFPGVMLYLSFWFPERYRARYNAMFNLAIPTSYVISALISGAILSLDGVAGISGWRWLFLLEGLPSILLGFVGAFYLTNRPSDASWLSAGEREVLQNALSRDEKATTTVFKTGIRRAVTDPVVLLLGLCNFAIFCGLTSLAYWLPQIIHGFGFRSMSIGMLTSIPPVIGLVGMLLMSTWSDRKGSRFKHTALATALAAIGFLIAGTGSSVVLVIVGFGVANVGVYASQAIFWSIPQSILSREMAPAAMGLIGMLGSAGGATMPIVVGRLHDLTHTFSSGLSVVAVVLFSASLVLFSMHSLAQRPAAER
ncbi:MFS transporter [Paraburkholderia sp. MM5482-R1]|uniref:MFS transporter n=1 Tax=unclassified Paraburkholderia TaxID=2615204 RepID=UPI003D1C63F0